jgi:glycosyltransferase involved in cell wall biosynthesis
MLPKISIVTVNYNLGSYLERTIESVLSQKYPNLEYVVIDGGSTDQSVEILEKYKSQFSYFISEPDKGLYNALNKGFSKTSGDIMGWINSDDLLHPKSLFKIAAYFQNDRNVNWLQGKPCVYNETDEIIFEREAVNEYNFFLNRGYKPEGTFIQQESTFWRKELWNKAGGYLTEDYSLAGDFELWMRFFKYSKLYCTNEKLGGFRKRDGQLSSNFTQYIEQADEIVTLHLQNLSLLARILLQYYTIKKLLLNINYIFKNHLKSLT